MDQREVELRKRFDLCKRSLLGKIDTFTQDIAIIFARNDWRYGWDEYSHVPTAYELQKLLTSLITSLDYNRLISDKTILRTSGFIGFVCQSCGRMEVSIFYNGEMFYGEIKLVPESDETEGF